MAWTWLVGLQQVTDLTAQATLDADKSVKSTVRSPNDMRSIREQLFTILERASALLDDMQLYAEAVRRTHSDTVDLLRPKDWCSLPSDLQIRILDTVACQTHPVNLTELSLACRSAAASVWLARRRQISEFKYSHSGGSVWRKHQALKLRLPGCTNIHVFHSDHSCFDERIANWRIRRHTWQELVNLRLWDIDDAACLPTSLTRLQFDHVRANEDTLCRLTGLQSLLMTCGGPTDDTY
jgi:hypothetical protein